MRKRLISLLGLVLLLPSAAWGTISGGFTLSIDGLGFSGCGIDLLGGSGAVSSSLSSSDAGNPDVCTGNYDPGDGLASAFMSVSPAHYDLSVSAVVSTSNSFDGVLAQGGAGFQDSLTVTVPHLADGAPLKVAFDYSLVGSCSATPDFSCVGDYQIRLFSTTLARILVSQSGATGPLSSRTATGSIFNGFEFGISGSMILTARGGALDPPGGGEASGSFESARITRMYVYTDQGDVIEPSLYSVDILSGEELLLPEPDSTTQGLCCIAVIFMLRKCARHSRAVGGAEVAAPAA